MAYIKHIMICLDRFDKAATERGQTILPLDPAFPTPEQEFDIETLGPEIEKEYQDARLDLVLTIQQALQKP